MRVEGQCQFGTLAAHHDAQAVMGVHSGFIAAVILVALTLLHVTEVSDILARCAGWK